MAFSVQPLPSEGVLHENRNLYRSQLAKRVGKSRGAAYSYIVRTVYRDQEIEAAMSKRRRKAE